MEDYTLTTMCYDCWKEAGSPAIITEETLRVAELIGNIYDHSLSGGDAHIVVDDWNLQDGDIAFCLNQISENEGKNKRERLDAERTALAALHSMSLPERYSAMAIHNRFIGPRALKIYTDHETPA